MILLDRSLVVAPESWEQAVEKAFPNLQDFFRRVAEFEGLDVDCKERRKGFRSFSPEVLPLVTKNIRDFRPLWQEAKEALRTMSNQKCSYCEARIGDPAEGMVEHFRPKSLFPSLVYDWMNFFLSCVGCNVAKGRKWPREGGCYVRPDEGDPGSHFRFLEDGTIEAVEPGGDADRTIKDFRLNTLWRKKARRLAIESELKETRAWLRVKGLTSEVLRELLAIKIDGLRDPVLSYSLACRQCFEREWAAAFPGEPL